MLTYLAPYVIAYAISLTTMLILADFFFGAL